MIKVKFLVRGLISQVLWIFVFISFYARLWVRIKDCVIILEIEIFKLIRCDFILPFIFDKIGIIFVNLVLTISACVFIFSSSYIEREKYLSRFMWLVLLFVISICFLIFIPNLISLLIGWDGLGLVSFLLVIYYQRFYALRGGLVTVMINRVGDVALLVGIGWSLSQGHWIVIGYDKFIIRNIVCLIIIMAGITKSAQIPFSRWLPAAMAAPTPVSALVHSSTLVTAGVFLVIRFFEFLKLFDFFFNLLLIVGVITIFIAGIVANLESDIKKVIALSTLRQLGVMIGSLGAGFVDLAFFHLATHALFKALLFLCAGHFIHIGGHYQDVRMFGQIGLISPLVCVGIIGASLALCGFPFIAGFYSKDIIIEGCSRGLFNLLICLLFFISAGLTASYSLRLRLSVITGLWRGGSYISIGDNDWCISFPVIVLFRGAVISGSYFSWSVFLSLTDYCLPLYLKSLIIIIVIVGFFLGYHIWSSSLRRMICPWNFKSFNWGVIKIWFMVDLNTQWIINFWIKFGGKVIKFIETGWIEILSAQGVVYFRLNNIKGLSNFINHNWIIHVCSVLFIRGFLLLSLFYI